MSSSDSLSLSLHTHSRTSLSAPWITRWLSDGRAMRCDAVSEREDVVVDEDDDEKMTIVIHFPSLTAYLTPLSLSLFSSREPPTCCVTLYLKHRK